MSNPDERQLYTPAGVDVDTLITYGVKLVKSGASVRVHEHSYSVNCPSDGVTCYDLTSAGRPAKMVSASKQDPQHEPLATTE